MSSLMIISSCICFSLDNFLQWQILRHMLQQKLHNILNQKSNDLTVIGHVLTKWHFLQDLILLWLLVGYNYRSEDWGLGTRPWPAGHTTAKDLRPIWEERENRDFSCLFFCLISELHVGFLLEDRMTNQSYPQGYRLLTQVSWRDTY